MFSLRANISLHHRWLRHIRWVNLLWARTQPVKTWIFILFSSSLSLNYPIDTTDQLSEWIVFFQVARSQSWSSQTRSRGSRQISWIEQRAFMEIWISVSGADRARDLAKKLGPINMPPGNENRLLTTLTGMIAVDTCLCSSICPMGCRGNQLFFCLDG